MLLSKHKTLNKSTLVKVSCDIKSSPNCKKIWHTSYRVILKTRAKWSNKDCCNKCASKVRNSGSQNPAFKYPKNENFFEKIDSELQAYLLGWIASDGSVRPRTLHLELHDKDIEILRLFKETISPKSKIVSRQDRQNSYLTISSQKLINDVCVALDIQPGDKQNKVRLPKLPSKLMKHFIRGFLEGDGWISLKDEKYLSCGIASIDPALRSDIEKYSSKLNIACYINNKGVGWSSNKARAFLEHLYENAAYVLSRKHDVFDRALKLPKRKTK